MSLLQSGDNTMGFDWSDLANARAKKARTSALAKLVGAPEGVANPLAWRQAQENLKDPNVWNLYAYSQALKREDEKMDWGSAAQSLFTGGIADIVKGEAPGTGINKLNPALATINPVSLFFSSGTGMMYDIAAGLDKAGKTSGSFWNKLAAAVDRSLDPSGAVDTGTRYTGEGIHKAAPTLSPYLQSLGTAIGTLVGALTPITPFGGALVGNALGGKLQQGTRNKDYLDSWRDAGIVAGTYGVGKAVAPYLSSLVGDGTLGKVVGNLGSALAKKGVKTLASLMPNASWDTSVGGSEGVSNLLTALLGGATTNTSTGVSKALKALTGSTSSSLLTGKEVASRGLQSIGGESNTPKYAKNAISTLTSNPSELSDAVANMEIRNAGMIKQPEWLVNTADMEREDKIDYMQAIKQLLST